MNLKQAAIIWSSLPLFGCVMGTLFELFSSSQTDSDENTSKEEENDFATKSNTAAQKHFQQLQHIRGA
jgi:hypothetical protein